MSEPIRILHAVPKMNREGIQNFIMNVYRNIDKTKVQFDFLIHSKDVGDFDSEIIELGGKIFRINKLSGKYFFKYQKELKIFFEEHSEYKIVHAHLNLLSAFTLKVAKKMNIPVRIAHSHSNLFLNSGIKKLIKRYAKSIINNYSTHNFACSKEAGIWQFGNKKYHDKEIKIIYNGIDLDKFKFSKSAREKIRAQFNISDNVIVFGHSGGFREVKNHILLLNIFAEIKLQNIKSKLMLIGDGPLKNKIIQEAKELNILDDIIFIGSVSNVQDYLSALDIFIFPSLYEGLGISLIEAQAVGLPCFVSATIPRETKVSSLYFPISLNFSAKQWASEILEKLNTVNNNRLTKSAELNQYDIKNTARQLQNFYLQNYPK